MSRFLQEPASLRSNAFKSKYLRYQAPSAWNVFIRRLLVTQQRIHFTWAQHFCQPDKQKGLGGLWTHPLKPVKIGVGHTMGPKDFQPPWHCLAPKGPLS